MSNPTPSTEWKQVRAWLQENDESGSPWSYEQVEAIVKLLASRESDPEAATPNRLVCFLYELMRDEVPAGIVARLVKSAEAIEPGQEVKYTNKHVEAYARELVDRLLVRA